MKKVTLLLTALVVTSSVAFSQVQKGDSNIGINTQISSIVGIDAANASGTINFSYQYFVTDNISLGAGPLITFNTTDETSSTTVGLNLFGNYNFLLSNGKTLPYLGAQFTITNTYQDVSPSSYLDITNRSLGVNAGLKYFITERVNLDGNLSYTSILSTTIETESTSDELDGEGGLLQFTFGLGIILGKR